MYKGLFFPYNEVRMKSTDKKTKQGGQNESNRSNQKNR